MSEPYRIIAGDCIAGMATLEAGSVNCCVTSPPYFGLRDYGHDGQIGLEDSPAEYVAKLVEVFREVRRVLRDDGTVWLNLGDSYAGGGGYSPSAPSNIAGSKQRRQKGAKSGGIKPQGDIKQKDLIGAPWRVALALQADGWYLRQDIIWHKPFGMPENVTDRCTRSHEYLFLLSKRPRYHIDAAALREPAAGCVLGGSTRVRRSVWTVDLEPFAGAHFAPMPSRLVLPCVLAGCPVDGLVLDPFTGSGTVGMVAVANGRRFVGTELNPEYLAMAQERIAGAQAEKEADERQVQLFGGGR